MGILNVRVDDHVLDALREGADSAGVNLSEYVRDVLREVAVPLEDVESRRHGDEPAPESMRLVDRQILALLHDINAGVINVQPDPSERPVDDDAQYEYDRAKVLRRGYTGEYWREVSGFETELSYRDSRRLLDILTMFRVIIPSIAEHERSGTPLDAAVTRGLEFSGFDFNDALEGHMAGWLKHMMKEGKWSELKPYVQKNDNGNSHAEMLDIYSRMVTEYRRIMDRPGRRQGIHEYLLSREELTRIWEAQAHPNRRRGADEYDGS